MRIGDHFPWKEVEEQFAERFYDQGNGRASQKIRVMIGLYLLKSWTNLSDKKLVEHSKTDLLFKAFLGISPDDIESLPKDDSLMTKFRNRIGLEGQEIIDAETKKVFKKLKLIKGWKTQSDTSAITFNIPHPTDTGLLLSLVQSLGKAVQKAHPTQYIKRFVPRIMNKSKKLYKAWVLFGRGKKEKAIECLEELDAHAKDLLKKAKAAQKKLRTELRRTIGKTKEKGILQKNKEYQKKKRELEELNKHIALSDEVLKQTGIKIENSKLPPCNCKEHKENKGKKRINHFCQKPKPIKDRIINYYFPELRAIRRGKIGAMTEFGLKIFLNCEEGFITAIDDVGGNMNENKCVQKSLEAHKKEFEHYPRSYAYDRGLDDEKFMEKMEKKGCAMITNSKTGRKENKHENTRRGRKRLRERSAVEAKIGEGKRCHGWGGVKYKSYETAMMGILSGATIMNLKRLVKVM